jgi:acyl carrier protein
MEKNQIAELVINAVKDILDDETVEVNNDTVLLGNDAVVDSMGLVNLIVDIEGLLADNDIEVTLTSEKAMSQRNSPFRTVESLTDYIKELVG